MGLALIVFLVESLTIAECAIRMSQCQTCQYGVVALSHVTKDRLKILFSLVKDNYDKIVFAGLLDILMYQDLIRDTIFDDTSHN